jgi:AraC family transcriptional regulator
VYDIIVYDIKERAMPNDPNENGSSGLPRSQGRLNNARLKRVLAYIDDHLAEEITVADLAEVACLTIFHFARAFAATTGVSPHRYVGQRRLEVAKVMMATGEPSLRAVPRSFDSR